MCLCHTQAYSSSVAWLQCCERNLLQLRGVLRSCLRSLDVSLFDPEEYKAKEAKMIVKFIYPETGEVRERHHVTDIQKVMRSEGGHIERERKHAEKNGYRFRYREFRVVCLPENEGEQAWLD